MSAWGNFISESFGFSDLPKTEQRKRRNAVELGLFVLVSGLGYNLAYTALLYPKMNNVSLISLVVIGLTIVYYYFSKNYIVYRAAILLEIVVFGVLAQISIGGFVDASGVVLCTLLPALGALIFLDVRQARLFFYLFAISCAFTAGWEFLYADEAYVVPKDVSIAFFAINFIAIGGITYFLVQSAYLKMKVVQQELLEERNKYEGLLKNILPTEISDELLESGEVKARGYASATVLFTDIVGFSKLSKYLTPGELVSQLNSYFMAFDQIMEKWGMEKIKTVGDAYLAVTGIPTESFTHAEDAIEVAMEMQQAVDRINQSGKMREPFTLRVGIHTGPIVAGIVGVKKFTYDIWGDTVNIAARMEQNAEPGTINISESTYNLVFKKFKCTPRGKIKAKNMDDLHMYFVENRIEPTKIHETEVSE